MKIADIHVGSRVRKDSGDIQGLADSIARHGLLHPVVVMSGGLLVAGARRLEAVKLLGWEEVPTTTVNVDDLLSAERDENEARKDFTPTEAVAIGRLIEERERPKAEERSKIGAARGKAKRLGLDAHGDLPSASVALPPLREIIGAAVGMAGKTYEKAKRVVEAAEADPEKYGDLPAKMDATGQVYPVYDELESRGGGRPHRVPKSIRHPVHRKTPLPKPNLAVERAIAALGGICLGLEEINPDDLDPEKTAVWAAALKNSASILNRIARRMLDPK